MSDKTWQHHANPWSVWTRLLFTLPMILMALWSIKPAGLAAWLFLALVMAWTWINPRLFSVPKNTNNWASKVTFGERIWLNRNQQTIPRHHAISAILLSLGSGAGFLSSAYAAYQHVLIIALLGGMISWISKMWFCDRMVWLFEDMMDANPNYRSWLKE